MTVNILNPDSFMMQQSEGQWMKFAALILWKTQQENPLVVTVKDLQEFGQVFPGSFPTLAVTGGNDYLKFQIVDGDTAERMAEEDRKSEGHA